MTQSRRARNISTSAAGEVPGPGTDHPRGRDSRAVGRPEPVAQWLVAAADSAAADARVPVQLLGEYLTILAQAAITGRRPEKYELSAVRSLGQRAAEEGVDANRAVDLYLSAAWRLWQDLPTHLPRAEPDDLRAAADAVLRVTTDAVEVLIEGHQDARRQMVRHEESARRAFVDDLLRGDADVSRLVERAEPFGLDLGRRHQIVLAAPTASPTSLERAAAVMERVIVDHFGDRDVLVAIKDELLVMLVPGELRNIVSGVEIVDPATYALTLLRRYAKHDQWRVAVGRAFSGTYGVARSYEEAREAVLLARRLGLFEGVVPVRDLLVYRVLARDHAALVDLVHTLLHPLTQARGGAEPMLVTLETFFATGGVTTETARRLHLSVRTVTYRLARVSALTGHNPANPAHRLALQMGVTGARLLGWPVTELDPASTA